MFPWVYGFQWSVGNLIFLGIFFSVVIVIALTMITAIIRAVKDFDAHKAERIVWDETFLEMPPETRACRHELSGETEHRVCTNGFDCRSCDTHPKFIEKKSPALAPSFWTPVEERQFFGFTMPLDRYYHRGHAWAKPERDGTMTVGLDDFGERLIGKADEIQLPSVGTKLHANAPAWSIKKNGTRVRVLSPVDGEVIKTGEAKSGWYLKMRPLAENFDVRHLLCGYEIKPWLLRELERLQKSLAGGAVGVTMADGGLPVEDFSQGYAKTDWDAVLGEMFLEG